MASSYSTSLPKFSCPWTAFSSAFHLTVVEDFMMEPVAWQDLARHQISLSLQHCPSDCWKPLLAALSQGCLHASPPGTKGSPACDNSPSSLILGVFIAAWKLQRLLLCCLPPGGLTIPPFTRNQDSIREQQLELFKLYIFFFPSLHLPSFLLIQLIKSDQGCSDFSAQSFSLSN